MNFVLVALGVVALSTGSPVSAAASARVGEQRAASIKPVPAELPELLARVNGEGITKAELAQAVAALEQRDRQQVPDDQRDRIYRGLLDELIGLKLLQQEARARKTDVDKMLDTEVNARISVQPRDVDDFYAHNPDQFKMPERARASHILIGNFSDGKGKESARAKAADILRQIRSGGDFAALAKQYSEDPGNSDIGGDIGYFPRNQMVPPFEKAVWALQPGEVSDVVETGFGFHIIKLTDRQAARTLTLTEVRPQLEQFLRDTQSADKTEAFIETLKAKGKVDILL